MKKICLVIISFLSFQVEAQVAPCIDSPLFSDTANHIPILINEIMPEGLGGETWVELYNCREDTVDLGGWFFTNDPMDSIKFLIVSPYLIAPAEFKVLSLPFTISRSFGTLRIQYPDSSMAYGMTFDGVRVGESVGFCGGMIKRQIPSPGGENTCLNFVTGISSLPDEKEVLVAVYDLYGRKLENIMQLVSGVYLFVYNRNERIVVEKKCVMY